jgi:hypothetical protein
MLDILVQSIIGLSGVVALFLTIRGNKWGCIVGIAGQPFWIFMSIQKKLPGVFVVSIAYLLVFAYGFVTKGDYSGKASES